MWRAVDSEGEGLEILVQSKRAKAAACFRHCFRRRGLVHASNRVENSHQPFRQRERKMQGVKSTKSGQRFVSVHAVVYNMFNMQRHLISRLSGVSAYETVFAGEEWRISGT